MTLCANCLSPFSSDADTYYPWAPAPSSLLRSNTPLGKTEVQDFCRRIVDASSKIQTLNLIINQLRSVLEQYEAARDNCQNYVATHRRRLSVIHSVPPEIWSEIFLCHQRSHVKEDSLLSFSTYDPFHWHNRRFGAVCSLWRNTMEITPRLWANISLSRSTLRVGTHQLMNLWLERSRQHPITVYVCGTLLTPSDHGLFSECLRLIMCNANRWQKLDITMPSLEYNRDSFMDRHWPYSVEEAPVLQSCRLVNGCGQNPLILRAPLLKTVEFTLSGIGSLSNVLPLLSATYLTLKHKDGTFTAKELARCLDSCPLLQELTITCRKQRGNHSVPSSRSHSTLKTLSIYFGRPIILSNLEAPAMTSLTLSCDFVGFEEDAISTYQFIRRSPSLKALALYRRYELLSFDGLNDLTHIEELTLGGTESHLESLTLALRKFADPCVLPGVIYLIIHIDLTSGFALLSSYRGLSDGILEVCQKRLKKCSPPPQLKQIYIKIKSSQRGFNKSQKELECLHTLTDTGIYIDLIVDDQLVFRK